MKDDGFYTDTEIVDLRKQHVNGIRMAQREIAKRSIHAWIKDDLGMAAKMTVRPEHVEKLLDRLFPASANPQPQGA